MDNPVAVVGVVAIVALALSRPIIIRLGNWFHFDSKGDEQKTDSSQQ